MNTPYFIYNPRIQKKLHYRVTQNSRISNLEIVVGKDPVELEKYVKKIRFS
jgi:hypothetical protein